MNSSRVENAFTHLPERLAIIDAEILTLKARIHQLRYTRNSILPISRIPPEVLTAIFSLVRSRGGGKALSSWRRDPICLTAVTILPLTRVCRSWRDIALSCAALWSHFDRSNVQLASHWLARTQSHGLSVTFHETMHLRTSAFGKLLDHFSRFQDVVLPVGGIGSHDYDADHKAWSSPAPRLENLELSHCGLPSHLFAGHAPLLTRLALKRCGFDWGALSGFTSLSRLSIIGSLTPTTTVELYDLLSALPSLTSLALSGIEIAEAASPEEGIAHRPSIQLRYLQRLDLGPFHSPSTTQLLAAITPGDRASFRITFNPRTLAEVDIPRVFSIASAWLKRSAPINQLVLRHDSREARCSFGDVAIHIEMEDLQDAERPALWPAVFLQLPKMAKEWGALVFLVVTMESQWKPDVWDGLFGRSQGVHTLILQNGATLSFLDYTAQASDIVPESPSCSSEPEGPSPQPRALLFPALEELNMFTSLDVALPPETWQRFHDSLRLRRERGLRLASLKSDFRAPIGESEPLVREMFDCVRIDEDDAPFDDQPEMWDDDDGVDYYYGQYGHFEDGISSDSDEA